MKLEAIKRCKIEELLLTEIYPPKNGGSGRWLSEVYRRFDHNTLTVTETPKEPHFENINENTWVARIPFEISETGGFSPTGAKAYFSLAKTFSSLCQYSEVQIVSGARVVPEGWVLWLCRHFFRGPQYQIFAHGEEINLNGANRGGVMSSRQHRWMAGLVFRSATRIIANSKNTAGMLEDQWKIPNSKLCVANPGVDTEFFKPIREDDTPVDRPCHLERWPSRFVVLTVGRLQKRKGHDYTLQAIASLKKDIPEILYVIAGSGEEESNLRRLVTSLEIEDHVEFKTELSDSELLRCYQMCDLFVLANRQIGSDVEGFGMVLLEAAACGKPTIAGNSGGTREALVDGKTGHLVDSNNPADIAKKIHHLYNNPDYRHTLGQRGRKRVVEKFDWSTVAKTLEDSTKQLMH